GPVVYRLVNPEAPNQFLPNPELHFWQAPILSATAAAPIVIEAPWLDLRDGDWLQVHGETGLVEMNGTWQVTVDPETGFFTLVGSDGSGGGAYEGKGIGISTFDG